MTNATTLESIREQAQSTMDGPAPKRPASPPVTASVCPYCGHRERDDAEECSSCRGLFEPLSRIATQNAMGPWQIRDEVNPFRPGCSIETLRALIRRGKLTQESVIRGPSTMQFWRTAAQTPGVSHLLGVCHACAGAANAEQHHCGSCGASFLVDADRNRMGLDPVRPIQGPGQQTEPKPVGHEPTPPAPAFLDLFSAPPAGGVRPSMDSSRAAEHRRHTGSRPVRHAVAAATVALGAAALSVAVWAASAAGPVEPAKAPAPETPAPVAAPAQEPGTDAVLEGPDAPSQADMEAWRARIDEAAALGDTEDIESLKEAIAALRDIQTSASSGVLPDDLDERIEALERRLDDLTLARFLERDRPDAQDTP